MANPQAIDPQVQAAIIALLGVIFTIIITVYLNIRQMNTELKKLRTESKQKITDQLLEKRLETYPKLYDLISSFDKKIRFGTVPNPEIYNLNKDVPSECKFTPLPQSDIKQLFEDILVWDSQYAVFLSAFAGGVLHNLRLALYPIIQMDDKMYLEEYGTPIKLKELKIQAHRLEFALKLDLGIFDVEFFDTKEQVFSYEKLNEFIEKRYIRKKVISRIADWFKKIRGV